MLQPHPLLLDRVQYGLVLLFQLLQTLIGHSTLLALEFWLAAFYRARGMPRERGQGIRKILGALGPGVVSGAANDDPSCISTCAVAGAAFGYLTLWTAVFLLPLAWAVQLMSSRLGMITGRGLAGAVRVNFPAWVVLATCGLLFVANVINIGADLGGMAEAAEMVTGIPAVYWTPLWADGARISDVPPALPHHRAPLQVAYPGAVRLRGGGLPGRCGLGTGAAVFASCRRWSTRARTWPCWWEFWELRSLLICFSGRPRSKWRRITCAAGSP